MRSLRLLFALCCVLAAGRPASGQSTREFVRLTPDLARDSIETALRKGLSEQPAAAVALQAARTLASTYADVWDDPFLADRVGWASRLNAAERAVLLEADSLRRLGMDQFFREGPDRAQATWRRAGQRFALIGDRAGSARIRANIGAAFYERGSLDSATVYLQAALEAAQSAGDRRTAGNAATILGNVAWERGDLRTAIERNLKAAELHEAAGNYGGVAADHNNAGLIAETLGDLDLARRHYTTALEISERHNAGERAADYLHNLGNLAARRLEVEEARTYYERALALYRVEGESVNEALTHRNLGALEASVSAYDAAIVEYRQAIALYRSVDDRRGELEVLRLLASVFAALGRLDEALEAIHEAEEHLRSLPESQALAAGVAVVRGDISLALNRSAEARASYDHAERLYEQIGDMPGRAAAAQGHAQLELARGQHHEAIRRLEPVVALQPLGRSRAWSQLLLGMAYFEAKDSTAAERSLTAAQSEFMQAADRAGVALALGAEAELATRSLRLERALRLLDEARVQARGLPSIEWWLHMQIGQALEDARELDGATAHYDSAIVTLEGLADWVRFDDRRSLYLDDKWEAYAALARLWARRGESAQALKLSERLRARHLLDQLARQRIASRSEGALRAQETRLAQRIGELSAELLSVDSGRRGPASAGTAELREDLLATQAAYRRLLDRMRDDEPDYVRALRGETVSVDSIQGALRPEQLLIEYLVTEDQLWIFAVSDSGVSQMSLAVGRPALRAQIDFARWAIENEPERVELWQGALRRLDDILLEPVRSAGLLEGRSTVIIVPHLELHYLPFEALIDGDDRSGRYFVEGHDVVYTPSASVWLRIKARSGHTGRGLLAMAPLDRQLPGTVREVEGIRSAWRRDVTVRKGAAAGEDALKSVAGYRVVHLATRGVLNRHNPLFSYVELRPQERDDGRLEVHEVLRLRLPADLVVLSACQTALGSGAVSDVPNGDDWIGLVRAFIHAGANNVVATLWAIDDLATAEFIAMYYRRIAAGDSYAHALAGAKREAIRSGGLARPYFWAGFVFTGNPGR